MKIITGRTRLAVAASYAAVFDDAWGHAEAARLLRGILDVETRVLGP